MIARSSFLGSVLIGLSGLSWGLAGQEIQQIFTPDEQISTEYETWSLFLICNPTWASPDAYERVEGLFDSFVGFGRAIGEDHLAVWFWRDYPRFGQEELVSDLDVERSVRFCELYDLRPSRGPHVLVTTSFPNLDERAPEYGTVELADADPENIGRFLVSLADALYADDIASLNPQTETFWFRLFQAIRAPIRRLSQDVAVTIESGPLKLEWSGGGS